MVDGRSVEDLVVGILGGTGHFGRGFGVRLAAAGQRVLLGSRQVERAEAAAEAVTAHAAPAAGGTEVFVRGGLNADVAGAADVVVIAVPYAGQAGTLAGLATPLAGKVVVDCVVPMGWDDLGAYVLDVPEGSACQQAAGLLPDSAVVGAFHHVSAPLLGDLSRPTVDGDVLVVGDSREATDLVQQLAGRLPGMRGVYGGLLRNARQVEALTINLVSVNQRYGAHAGIRVTDV
ncbi:NADPH-dependent F420 reductase [Modestobacter sp. NPDC049651]|uniref:NADPH-dependent F420 reductase n=1 Tax=unclassified Modestobacter TaxID=2643866 RepID=UPI0033D8FC01